MIQQLTQQINQKERELFNLLEQYNQEVEAEKTKVLKQKSRGMDKSLYLLGFTFESSSSRTPQYLEFHKIFKKEFTALLKSYTKRIEISKPNHFDVSGFFELNNGQIYYFGLEDLRWSKDSLLIREAKDFKDYTGGSNGFINLDKNFAENLKRYLRIGE